VIAVLIFGGVLFLTVLALWPALWVAPFEVAWNMYNYVGVRVSEGNEGGRSFFLGRPYFQEELNALFYPVTLLYRVGPVTWLGLILLAVMMWPMRQLSRQSHILVGILLFYLLIYLALITRSSLKFGRFIVPMLPILSVMAALGFVTVWQQLARRMMPKVQLWGWLMALLILVGQAALALPYHPYYYTFWNPVLGGLKQAVHVLPVGLGGEGIDQVAAYLNALPNAETLTLASGNSQKIRPILKAQTIALENLDGKWTQADYVMIYISQLQRGKHAEDILVYLNRHQPVYVTKLHGLEYAWLYPGPKAQYHGGGHKLEGRGTLFGYDLQPTTLTAGDSLTTTLYWRNEGQREDDRFFVRLMDLDGYIWAEAVAQARPGFEEASRQRLSIVESEANLTLPVGMPPGDYFFKPGFRTAQGELIGYFELPDDTKPLVVALAQTYPPIEVIQPAYSTHLAANEDILLFGYDVTPKENSPDPAVWLTLYWQALADVTHDYVILLRLLNDNQEEVAYWLGRPVRSGYPTLEWKANQIVQDPWLLTLPSEVKPGDYHLEVALFDADSEAEVSRQIVGRVNY
jgi:hypothetical protein